MSLIPFLYALTVIYMFGIIAFQFYFLKGKANIYATFLFVSALVANFGFLWFASSNNLSEALVSQRVIYLGNVPLLFFTLVVIADICKFELSHLIKSTLAFISILVVALSSTIGSNQLFYKSATFYKENGYAYLVKEYGPGHNAYIFLILGYMIGSLLLAFYALLRPTNLPKKMAFSLAMTEVLCSIVYFGERALGLNFEALPFAYCLSIAIIIYIITKQYLYDADRVALSVKESNRDNAVILFDKNKRYIGSNTVAKDLFEEINDYYVECAIPDKYSGKKYFEGIIDRFEADKLEISDIVYEKDNTIYRIHVKRLIDETIRGDRGYFIEFVDDTSTQNYIKKISEMNEELEEAANAANAANEAKSSFLANMSHEIRTPINAVLGLNSIILRDSNEETIKEYASDIDSAGKSLLSIINDILDISKVEAGKMDIVPVEYRLGALINDCKNMMYSRFRDKNIDFIIQCDETAPSVLLGDEVRVRQIIINLLSNAVKYTETGSVTLDVKYTKETDKKTIITFSVIDTGQGISKENQEYLFDAFKRVDEVKNRNIEGTGLGLALVKHLVNLMDGTISLESEVGKGSTFTVTIPQVVVSDVPVGKIVKTSETVNNTVKMEGLADVRGDILVVDDVKVNLKVITMLLKKSGLTVDTADSGFEALDKAKEKKYDIIFLDHMMPVMDGIETLHKLRADDDSPNRNTPAVMLTANAVGGIKEQYLGEGFDDYISKPVNFTALENVIKSIIK